MKRLVIIGLSCIVGFSNLGLAADKTEEAEKNIRELLQDLKTGLFSEKQAALSKIGAIKDEGLYQQWNVTEAILEATDHRNPRLARLAVQALGDIAQWHRGASNDDIKKKLISILNIGRRQKVIAHAIVRSEICIQLSRMTGNNLSFIDDSIVDALEKATKPNIKAPSILVRMEAIKALGKFARKSSLDVLRASLSSDVSELQNAGVEAVLSALKGKDAKAYRENAPLVSKLMELASSKKVKLAYRASILESLARIIRAGGRLADFSKKLTKLLKETDDSSTAIAALKAVAISADEKAASLLPELSKRFNAMKEKVKKDTDESAKEEKAVSSELDMAICETIGELFSHWGELRSTSIPKREYSKLVVFLGEIVVTDTAKLQTKAAYALGHAYSTSLDRTKVAAYLIAALPVEGISEETKKAIMDSLKVITSQPFGDDVVAWEKWYEKNKRSLSAK